MIGDHINMAVSVVNGDKKMILVSVMTRTFNVAGLGPKEKQMNLKERHAEI